MSFSPAVSGRRGGVAAQVLVTLGADLNQMREQVIQLLPRYQGVGQLIDP